MAIQSSRIKVLNSAEPRHGGRYVLYWMQASQRTSYNHALEYAVEEANRRDLPLVVCFGLTDGYPEANARHYAFMLEGLAEVQAELKKRGIGFVIRRGSPDEVALHQARDATLIICDRGYLKPQRAWRSRVAAEAICRVVQVESEVVVPVERASPKHEFAARTFRPKVQRVWDEFLVPLETRRVRHRADDLQLHSNVDLGRVPALVASLQVDQTVPAVRRFRGGGAKARKRLRSYLRGPFQYYGQNRGLPEAGAASHMSPFLHYGQIAPLEIALAVRDSAVGGREDKTSYLEELIVRRELAMNHVFYEERYDTYEAVPEWARTTLANASSDPRPFDYTPEQLDKGETHDRYWNAAMKEMRSTGYMHNHMRMYWGKKIIEWSPSPQAAFETTLRLNNRYFLDGRDANSFTNVGWLFGLHDRPWFKRPVFGTVRYMGNATLKKFDADAYVRTVDELAGAEGPGT